MVVFGQVLNEVVLGCAEVLGFLSNGDPRLAWIWRTRRAKGSLRSISLACSTSWRQQTHRVLSLMRDAVEPAHPETLASWILLIHTTFFREALAKLLLRLLCTKLCRPQLVDRSLHGLRNTSKIGLWFIWPNSITSIEPQHMRPSTILHQAILL